MMLLLGNFYFGNAWGALKFQKLLEILSIIGATWMGIGGAFIFQDIILLKYDITQEDNLNARKVVTQASFIRRIVILVFVIIGTSLVLLSFDGVRKLGAGLITSAGIFSIVLGIAAQKPLANLLSGLQIAFTQPIRIDDAVIVENEWGWIEEINLTYVVVRLWDWRRLILPITYFTEKPFQNWTRTEANLLGSVFLYVDYRLPTEDLRQQLHKILDEEPLWDKKNWVLQVVESKEQYMIIRCLMSAESAPEAWDLRCIVREKLIDYIGKTYPEFLPRFRLEKEAVGNGKEEELNEMSD